MKMAADIDLTGRVAIVTGAGKGLGRAYALWLAGRGCAVVVNNRISSDGTSSARAVAAEITNSGGKAVAHEQRVESEAAGQSMVELALDRFKRVDILIANAGVQRWTDFADLSVAEMREVLDVSLWGTLFALKPVWPVMTASGYGRIVLTSSGAGLWGQRESVAYCAAKAAMIGIARGLALDVPAGADIRVNVIAPAAYTPMSAGVIDAKWAGFMAAERVAPVVGWLASEACNVGGAIYHAGAGRVRRVRIVESERIDVPGDLTELALLDGQRLEPGSSFGAGAELMPELFETG